MLEALALVLAIVAVVWAARVAGEVSRLRVELRLLRSEVRVPAGAAAPGSAEPPEPALSAEELRLVGRFAASRERLDAASRSRLAEQLAARFEGRFDRRGRDAERFLLDVLKAAGVRAGPEPMARATEGPSGKYETPYASTGAGPGGGSAGESAGEPRSTRRASAPPSEPRPAPTAQATPRGLDLETRVGATWALRLGLAAVAIAVALFARTLLPSLGPGVKVALAYAGALGLFGIGKAFESRLERFARPVMAGGLAIAFFVSYASYFVPAMRSVPLVPALAWMAAGVVALLVLAERWGSEPTAGLAIFLGHVSAYVAGGVTEVYSVVVVIFLAAAAGVLLYRHDWLPLSLFALAASYGSHVLWAMADRSPAAAGFGLTVNLLFLASYYAIFLGADLLWWARRGRAEVPAKTVALARSLGPANLALATSVTALLYLSSGGPVERLAWVFFGLGAAQAALWPAYRRLGNPDHRHYPALGAVLATLGFAALLDGLSLSLVLALEAIALLVAAHATRMRVFHLLAQAALAANFLHYWGETWPKGTTLAGYLGGLAIVAAYLVQARLEESWYGRGKAWAGDAPAGIPGRVARAFDAAFGAIAPLLPWAHAVAAAFLVSHLSLRYSGAPDGLLGMGVAAAVIAVAGLTTRSPALLLGSATAQAVIALVVPVADAGARLLLGLGVLGVTVPIAVMLLARSRGFEGRAWRRGAALAQLSILAALVLPLAVPAPGDAPARLAEYLPWIAMLAVAAGSIEAARRGLRAAGDALSPRFARFARGMAGVTAVAVAVAAIAVTERLVGGVVSPAWTTGWAVALLAGALALRQPAFTLAAATLLLAGDAFWLVGRGLGDAAVQTTWLMALLAGVPLAAGLVLDRLEGRRMVGNAGATDVAVHAFYLLGSALAFWWCEVRLDDAWSSVAFAAVPALLALATLGAGTRRGLVMAVPLMLVALADQVAHVAMSSSGGFAELLAPGLLLAAAGLALEQALARAGAGGEGRRFARLALLLTATVLALVTVNGSAALGGPRTTIGWSLIGGVLMGAGFALRSAEWRRVALGVLGIAVVRVFAVDTRGLSDAMKTLAFLALGVSLIVVAWLYSRFGPRLREWL